MKGVSAVPLYGGAPIDRQIRGLRNGAQIVVGTPGRLFDHLKRRTLDTKNIKLCILDEADRMLDMGFRDEMEELLEKLPEDLQTLFFSATMNKNVERLIRRFSNDPAEISVQAKTKTVESIDQSYYEVRNRSKVEFCNTKRAVDECTEALLARGYSADRLHGDITQQLRERVIQRFRERYTKQKIRRERIPSQEVVEGKRGDKLFDQLREKLESEPDRGYKEYIDRLLETGSTATDIASTLFGMLRESIGREGEEIIEDNEGDKKSRRNDDRGERRDRRDRDGRRDRRSSRDSGDREFERSKRVRSRNKDGEAPRLEKGMTQLFIGLGSKFGIRAGDIVGMLYSETQLQQGNVGKIRIFPKHCLVQVPLSFKIKNPFLQIVEKDFLFSDNCKPWDTYMSYYENTYCTLFPILWCLLHSFCSYKK